MFLNVQSIILWLFLGIFEWNGSHNVSTKFAKAAWPLQPSWPTYNDFDIIEIFFTGFFDIKVPLVLLKNSSCGAGGGGVHLVKRHDSS